MLVEQLKKQEEFTENEKIIAQYILDHMDLVKTMSAADLAKATYTSKSSVLRLCRKTGMEKYQDFKRQIELEQMETYRISAMLHDEPVTENCTYEDIIHIIPSIYEAAVTDTRLSFNRNTMRRIVNQLKRSDKIDIYGIGITHAVAKTAAFKFLTIGVESTAYDGVNEHYIIATRKKKKLTAIVISFTGCNPVMVNTARFLREQGIYVVGIGGNDGDDLKQYCSEFIPLYSRNLIMSMEVMTVLTSANYIMDILFVSLLVENYKENVESSVEVWKLRQRNEPKVQK